MPHGQPTSFKQGISNACLNAELGFASFAQCVEWH